MADIDEFRGDGIADHACAEDSDFHLWLSLIEVAFRITLLRQPTSNASDEMLDIVRVPRGHKISIDDDGTVIAPNPTAGFDDRADDEVGKFLVQMKTG
jgi:hypothetical protein